METMSIALREAKRSRFIRMVPELERFARGSKHQDTLTDEELSKLFPEDKAQLEKIWRLEDGRDHDTGMLFGAMCCLGISAGLRSGELRAVSADQIIRKQLKNGEMLYGLIVDKALGDDQEIVGLKKAKADDLRVRVVMLSEKTMRTLDMYLESVPQREGLLFLHRGHPIRKETLGRRWAAGLRKAKISTVGRRLTPHSMRYTYNTRMRMLVSEQALQEMIGHKSEDMTALYDRPHLEERLYQLEDQRSSVEKFWERTTQH
jgi:integrase